MNKVDRRRELVVLVAASAAGCALLIHLLYDGSLVLPSPIALWRLWTPWNAVMEEKVVRGYMSRLVKGDDQRNLNSTGLSCQRDVHAHVCLLSSLVRIEAPENRELMVYHPYTNASSETVAIKPYARQEDPTAMERVKPVHIFHGTMFDVPHCDYTHNVPAAVFSSSGFVGNLFHEFNEIIIPLFLTCRHFNKQIQFVITDLQPLFVEKYRKVLTLLSDYSPVTQLDGKVHCFPGAVVGLKYHENLAVNTSEMPKGYDIRQFKDFLREAYIPKKAEVQELLADKEKPVLVLISRRKTRVFLNEDEMVRMMVELGYDVTVADTNMTANVDKFAKVVNQCSVMVGAHGAGLTNQVFLPAGAVLVQVVPLGLDWPSNAYYGEPAGNMGVNYFPYKIEPEESSLVDVYGRDSPVVTDPMTVFVKGYRASRAVYLDGQNLKINIPRFKDTLDRAFKLVKNISSTD